MRLPNVYKSFTSFEGLPEPEQQSAPLIQFFNGEDVVLEGYCEIDGEPIQSIDWDISAVVKSGTFASNTIWDGNTADYGVYTVSSRPGYYKVFIPAIIFEEKASGTFWMDLIATEKVGKGEGLKDRTAIVARVPFGYDTTASSPRVTHPRTDSERTYPPPVNITKL